MRSEFESHFRKTLFYLNMLSSAAENGIAISPFEMVRGQYRNTYVQLAYSVYSHQQSKVDELQKRVDAAMVILSSKKKMYVDMFIELEQALKRVLK